MTDTSGRPVVDRLELAQQALATADESRCFSDTLRRLTEAFRALRVPTTGQDAPAEAEQQTPITPPPPPSGPASASPRPAAEQAATWPEHLDFSVSHDTDPRAVALNAAAIACSQGAGANATYSRAATPQDVLEHANAYLAWLTSDLNTPR